MTTVTTALRAIDVHKTYRRGREQVHALGGVSIEVRPGEVVALLGRSGSGKTTLLNCLLGWERPDRGAVEVPGAGNPAAAAWSTVAIVPQRFGLLEELTLADNVAMAARLGGVDAPRDAAIATLETLRLGHLAHRLPDEVSLGEQQRTAIARALVLAPRLAVLDEPTGHQDDEHVGLILNALVTAARAGTLVLVATHDQRVIDVADETVRLRSGRIEGR